MDGVARVGGCDLDLEEFEDFGAGVGVEGLESVLGGVGEVV